LQAIAEEELDMIDVDTPRGRTMTAVSLNRPTALQSFFSPASVAVIGATDREDSVGRTVLANLLSGSFHGRVYAVNPTRKMVLGVACHAKIGDVPEKVDLAVVVTPAPTVPDVIRDCVAAGVASGIVISAGFKEKGADGAELERRIQAELRGSSMRVVGPNCLGMMNPRLGLNATFARDIARPGKVAFLSQSGALLTAILDWSAREQVGFSAIVSTGSMLDVGWGDLISFFGEDKDTQSIVLYMESVGDARSFLSAVREVALSKPIIVIKAGRSEAASKAAASHTGALTGSDEVFDAALRRCGVLRVLSISDLFSMAEVLSKQPRPRGPRLMILTNAGGPAVLATDALLAGGGVLAGLSQESKDALGQFLPPHWSHANPIDILGDADPERYARALDVAAKDPNSDGLLVILAPQGMTNPGSVAQALKAYASVHGKPVLASWMGGTSVAEGENILNMAGIPTFAYPDTAARAFNYMWRYAYNIRGLYETPMATDPPEERESARSKVRKVLGKARRSGRTLLTELESKEVLSLYGIPVVQTHFAQSETQAVEAASKIGFPVVLKVHSETITHKTDVGGVALNLKDEQEVRRAFRRIQASVSERAGQAAFLGVTVQAMARLEGYELILGSSVDAQFGPVLLFGSGGQLVEVYRDRALALPPLNTTLAQRFMEQTKIYTALKGVRGRKAVDMRSLEQLLVRFSELVVEHPQIKEADINPLLASETGLLALDARFILYDAEVQAKDLPRPAIRPYPSAYISYWTMEDGTAITFRPIRPEDELLMVDFHKTLSEQSVYFRFFFRDGLDSRVAHERLGRNCFIDYDNEMALVAERVDPDTGRHEILGVGRLKRQLSPTDGELAVVVSDPYQGRGMGREIVGRLIEVARREGFQRIVAIILAQNTGMLELARHFHFTIAPCDDPMSLVGTLQLK
jgi:acetyltransferase